MTWGMRSVTAGVQLPGYRNARGLEAYVSEFGGAGGGKGRPRIQVHVLLAWGTGMSVCLGVSWLLLHCGEM